MTAPAFPAFITKGCIYRSIDSVKGKEARDCCSIPEAAIAGFPLGQLLSPAFFKTPLLIPYLSSILSAAFMTDNPNLLF
jgi:hypothetical protein